jgi:DNA repair exonuclease SbcCD ATPase subunit
MFKFRKVRGPEQINDTLISLEESASRLENIVETAQKEKSRLHLLVGNVSNRMAEIQQTAASFENSIEKIAEYEKALDLVQKEIDSIKKQAETIACLKSETDELTERFNRFEKQLQAAQVNLDSLRKPAGEIDALNERVKQAQTEIGPQIDSLSQRQADLADRFAQLAERLEQAESQLGKFACITDEFEKTVAQVSQESARITTWMAANEKMANELAESNESLNIVKQKVDQLHELAEYVDTKTRALAKNKELLKNAHAEFSQANILFVEIKSTISEMSREFDRLKKAQNNAEELEKCLKSFESRFEVVESKSAMLNQLLENFATLSDLAKELKQRQQSFDSIDQLTKNLSRHIENARAELAALTEASAHVEDTIRQAEQLQNSTKSITQQTADLVNNAQKLLERLPEINTVLDEIENVRKRALAVENKLLENLAIDANLKEQASNANEIREKVASYHQETTRMIAAHKRELEHLTIAMNGLKGNLDSLRARWLEMPEILSKLAETEKRCGDIEKRCDVLAEKISEVDKLNGLLNQHVESFKKIETLASGVHQKAADIVGYRAELEKIEIQMTAVNTGINNLLMLGEKVEKQGMESVKLFDKITALTGQVKETQKISESIAKECEKMKRNQENLRLDAGEVMDLFGKLADQRTFMEEKSKELNTALEKTQAQIELLNESGNKAQSRMEAYHKTLADIKNEIKEVTRCQDELKSGFGHLSRESAQIEALAGRLNQQQSDSAALSEKLTELEGRLKAALTFENRLAAFESTLNRQTNNLDLVLSKLPEIEKIQERIDQYSVRLNDIDAKLAGITDTAAEVDRLYRQFSKINLITEELKARERTLSDEERLVNKAISAAARLEELVIKAEHIEK